MPVETGDARSGCKAREGELVGDDYGEARERHLQRVAMQQRNACERKAEQRELDRRPEIDRPRCEQYCHCEADA